MAKLRFITDYPHTSGKVCIFYNSEHSEYVCRVYRKGVHYEPADYFTECREDAFQTARSMRDEELKRTEVQAENEIQPGCFAPEYADCLRAFTCSV
jgi:hypothetical protein